MDKYAVTMGAFNQNETPLWQNCVAEEFEWRNGAFYEMSKAALQAERPDPCPQHTEGLKKLGMI